MVQTTGTLGELRHEGRLPRGWVRLASAQGLRFEGPRGGDGSAALVTVTTADGADDIDVESLRLMAELTTAYPDSLLANCELWPHPQWGDGRFVQSAHVTGRQTQAHDVYLFVADGQRIRIDVTCPLARLLTIEEAVAAIVARLRASEEDR